MVVFFNKMKISLFAIKVVTTLREVDGMRNRWAGGLLLSHQSEREKARLRVAQEYESCLLSGCVAFHAGERGENCTHRESKNKENNSKWETLENTHTCFIIRQHRNGVSTPSCGTK